MPHLTVHALDDVLTGKEPELIAALTDAVTAVYGDWARPLAQVRLIGLPPGRWGVGGRPVTTAGPWITFGIRSDAFERPDTHDILQGLATGVTDAVTQVLGEPVRPDVTIEFVPTPPERTATAGTLAPPPRT